MAERRYLETGALHRPLRAEFGGILHRKMPPLRGLSFLPMSKDRGIQKGKLVTTVCRCMSISVRIAVIGSRYGRR